MSYRFIRISDYYGDYLRNYYEKFPDNVHLAYKEQYDHLTDHSVDLVNSFSKYLRNLGVDAMDIVANAEPLQNKWGKEHIGIEKISFENLIFEQIKFYKPNVIWVDSTKLLNKKWIQKLRNEIPSLKLIAGHICAPYNSTISDSFSAFDMMFTCSPCIQKELSAAGLTTELVYHSFDHAILELLKADTKHFPKTDFVFTGSLYTGYGLHKSRIEYIEKMVEQGVEISIFGNLETRLNVFLKQSAYHSIHFLKTVGLSSMINKIPFLKNKVNYGDEKIHYYSKKLIKRVKPPVFGLEMFKLLENSGICFNIHGEIAKKCAGNVRLFEATGMGTCLLTDWKENLKELFDVDKEIVTYRSADECIEKVKWLMSHPDEASKIAKAGQERTLRSHTVEARAADLDRIFRSKL